MLECQLPNGIRRTIALLRSLDPIGAHLDNDLSTRGTKCLVNHTAAQLAPGVENDEVVDALLTERSSGNYTRHATTENQDGGMIGRGGCRALILGKHTRDG